MTGGELSQTKSMDIGMLRRHTDYRNKLAHNIALSVAAQCNENTKPQEVLNALRLKLQEFTTREETSTAFGMPEGGNIIKRQNLDENRHEYFIHSIKVLSTHDCYLLSSRIKESPIAVSSMDKSDRDMFVECTKLNHDIN